MMEIEICQNGLAAPKEMLHNLHDNQAQDARHQCPICAYNIGLEEGSRKNPNELPIYSTIVEGETGIYYPMKLYVVPQVGELIELYSYIEALDKKPAMRYYEVVQVLHYARDITEKAPISMKGSHSVRIFVKSSNSPFFKET